MARRPLIVRSVLADQVYDTLSERILDMHYAPGEKLVIDQLARELGVSATPVRDALTRLGAEHLVDSTPFRGFTVLADPTPDEISESFEAREAIERSAARLGCDRAPEESIERLREIQARIAAARYETHSGSFTAFVRMNQEFHEVLVESSGNRYLVNALRGLYHDALIARTRHGQGVPDLGDINEEHGLIIDAFEKRDVDALEEAVALHIRGGASRVLAARTGRCSELSLESCLTLDREAW